MHSMKHAHPMKQMGLIPQGMSGWFDDISDSVTEWGEDLITDPLNDAVVNAVGQDAADTLRQELEAQFAAEVDAQKKAAIQSVLNELNPQAPKAPTTSMVDTVKKQFDELNKNQYIAKFPGGVFGVVGTVAALGFVWVMRK